MSVVLLLEATDGNVVGVRFPSTDAARDWEDEQRLVSNGCVRVVSKRDALKEVTGPR